MVSINKASLKKFYLYLGFSALLLSGCNNQPEYHTKSERQVLRRLAGDTEGQPTITVWVHGTLGLSKVVFPQFFMSIPGMRKAHDYNPKTNLYKVAETLCTTDPETFAREDFYLFGWSGTLSCKARRKAAQELYEQLVLLVGQYKWRYGVTPKIRLVTHSHGGNVALYLAEIQTEQTIPLAIDELVMLACPVQKRTIHLIKDPMFKTIFSLYSKFDLIQVLDPQGIYEIKDIFLGRKKRKSETPFFSERKFPDQPNLIQKQATHHGRAITHLEFILTKFLTQFPDTLLDMRVSLKQKTPPSIT